MTEHSVWYGIFRFKCPRCREGDLFLHPNTYGTTEFLKMHKKCSHCGQTFTPEPGFYFGAAYISYMILVAVSLIAFAILFFVLGLRDTGLLIGVIIAFAVVLAPYNFRLSRSVWAHIFIRHKPRRS